MDRHRRSRSPRSPKRTTASSRSAAPPRARGVRPRTQAPARRRVGGMLVHDRVYRIVGYTDDLARRARSPRAGPAGSRAVASHRSAAALWELPGRSVDIVEITCPRWRRARHDGLVVHESGALTDDDTTVGRRHSGHDASSARSSTSPGSAVRRPSTSRSTTRCAASSPRSRSCTRPSTRLARRGRPGTQLFRTALADRDPDATLSESERERLLFRMLRRHGFPTPVPQYEIRDESGNVVARADFAYPDLKIAIEYDSYQEHTGKVALVRDSARRNAVVALGWAPIAATADDLRTGGAPARQRAATHTNPTFRRRSRRIIAPLRRRFGIAVGLRLEEDWRRRRVATRRPTVPMTTR